MARRLEGRISQMEGTLKEMAPGGFDLGKFLESHFDAKLALAKWFISVRNHLKDGVPEAPRPDWLSEEWADYFRRLAIQEIDAEVAKAEAMSAVSQDNGD